MMNFFLEGQIVNISYFVGRIVCAPVLNSPVVG